MSDLCPCGCDADRNAPQEVTAPNPTWFPVLDPNVSLRGGPTPGGAPNDPLLSPGETTVLTRRTRSNPTDDLLSVRVAYVPTDWSTHQPEYIVEVLGEYAPYPAQENPLIAQRFRVFETELWLGIDRQNEAYGLNLPADVLTRLKNGPKTR